MNKPLDTKCPTCGQEIKRKFYEQNDILLQTPQSVWKMYRENGYTIAEAIKEELSYA
jgi:hypothetical protein